MKAIFLRTYNHKGALYVSQTQGWLGIMHMQCFIDACSVLNGHLYIFRIKVVIISRHPHALTRLHVQCRPPVLSARNADKIYPNRTHACCCDQTCDPLVMDRF